MYNSAFHRYCSRVVFELTIDTTKIEVVLWKLNQAALALNLADNLCHVIAPFSIPTPQVGAPDGGRPHIALPLLFNVGWSC